ncbi:hypothetical protein, partial sequence, partial [Candidatus Phytoplasma solani]
ILLIVLVVGIVFVFGRKLLKAKVPDFNLQDILKQSFLESELRVIDRLDLKINNLTHQSKDSLTKEIKDTRQHLISNLENSLKVLRDQNASGFQEVQNIHKLLAQNDKTGKVGEFLLARVL